MAYTSHGHHIAGTPVELPYKGLRARCGGPVICAVCKREAGIFHNQRNNSRKKDS